MSMMTQLRRHLILCVGVTAFLGGVLVGCDPAPNQLLLTGTGGQGQTCVSTHQKIQVAGNLNPDLYGSFDLTRAPSMVNTENCVWVATLNGITAGDHFFKFVTDGAFDSPPDYGSDEVCRLELTGTIREVTGTGTAICITFPETGNYRFTLDEAALSYTIEQVQVDAPGILTGLVGFAGSPPAGLKAFVQVLEAGSLNAVASDSTATRFTFDELPAGDYRIRFSARGYLPDTISASVESGETTDTGTTTLRVGFVSAFTSIAIIGDFPTINWTPENAVEMTEVTPGIWRGTLTNTPGGEYFMKFRTNGDWESPNPDYTGTDVNETLQTSLTGPVRLTGVDFAGALHLQLPVGGQTFEFTLDEINLTYTIVPATAAPGTGVRR